jgi:hypothetical protein
VDRNLGLELLPVPEVCRRDTPEVVLQLTETGGTSTVLLVAGVPSILFGVILLVRLGHVTRALDGGVVDRLEDLQVELLCLGRVEGVPESHEGVGESLDSDANGTVSKVRVLGLLDGVVVDVDDAVQVERNRLDDLVELGKVVNAVLDERRKGDRGQVADSAGSVGHEQTTLVSQGHGWDSPLVRGRVLDDLRAEVRGLDGAQVLLV